jgi:hypothetical protein
VYVYGAKLEIASPRFMQRAEFITYTCFVCGVILVSCDFHRFTVVGILRGIDA